MILLIEMATVSTVLKINSDSADGIFTPRSATNFLARLNTKGVVNARQKGEKAIITVNPVKIASSKPLWAYCQPMTMAVVSNSSTIYIFILGSKFFTSSIRLYNLFEKTSTKKADRSVL